MKVYERKQNIPHFSYSILGRNTKSRQPLHQGFWACRWTKLQQ